MAYTKYSLTPANNNATPPDGAPEGMLPSAVNDTMRDMMAQIRDVGDGIRDGTYTMTAAKITGGTITGVTMTASSVSATSLTDSGNLTFTGTGNRIIGDFSNATEASRVAFQTSTTNGGTRVNIISNGTGTASSLDVFGVSDPTNAAVMRIRQSGIESQIQASITGTGTYLPLTMYTGGSERLRIDTSGNVGIGTSSIPYTTANRTVLALNATTSTLIGLQSGGTNRGYLYADTATLALDAESTNDIRIMTTGAKILQFSTNNAERMRITSGGNLLVGTTTNNASGGVIQVSNGITFPATQSASSDANTLDDYEEGTWTPVLTAATTAPTGVTYDTYRYGRYTKIGRIVYVRATVVITSKGTGGVGDVLITGLPFAAGDYSGYAYAPVECIYYPYGGITGDLFGMIIDNGSSLTLSSSTTPTNLIQWSTISGSEKISITAVYQVN